MDCGCYRQLATEPICKNEVRKPDRRGNTFFITDAFVPQHHNLRKKKIGTDSGAASSEELFAIIFKNYCLEK